MTINMEEIDHERDPDPEPSCCARYNPKEDPEEFCNCFSMCTLVFGIILITIGYLYPRNYAFDPYEKARVMEAIELYYSNLSFNLDLTIIIGMGFIGLGGIVYAMLFLHSVTEGTPSECCRKERDIQEIPLCERTSHSGSGGYGATSADSTNK